MKTVMSIVFCLSVLMGSFAMAADGGAGGSEASPGLGSGAVVTVPAHEKASFNCRVLQDTDMMAYLPVKATASQYALFRLNCVLDATSTVSTLDVIPKSSGMPGCSVSSSTTCVEKSNIPPRFNMTKSMSSSGIYFLVKNPNQRTADKITSTFFKLDLTPLSETPTDLTGKLTGLTTGVSVGGGTKDTSCTVYVSGASTSSLSGATCSGQGCTPSRAVNVENGKLIFQAAIIGGVGDLAIPKSILWVGGPEKSTGVWSSAPVGKDTTVTAQVMTQDGVVNYCSVKFNQYGQGYALKLAKYGDCPYYRALRNYYHLNSADSARQTGGYPQPLTIPGFDSKYGVTASDIPFRGVLNFAADTDGIVHVENGALVIPPLAKRRYSNPIVVARRLNTKGSQSVGEPVYYGILNPENYAETVLRPVGSEPSDDTLLVFQFYLAAKQEKTVNGTVIDLRGTVGGLPYYQFQDANASVPFDRLIPVVNDSCAPVFQIRTPARSDKALPKELQDAVTCAFSKPFKLGDFKAGRAALTLMHFTAESAGDEYPLDLISGNLGAPASTSTNVSTSNSGTASGPIACWIVNPASLGSPSWASGGSQGTVGSTSTSTSSSSDTIRERVPGDECSTRLHTNTTVTTTTTSTSQDLNGRLGFRYSYSVYAWGAAFGCAVSQNWPDRSVYGVVESSTAWTGASTAPPYGAGAPHFDKVSCVVGDSNSGLNEAMTMSPIPLQSFVFSKSTADAGQVRTQNFHVRPWGYDVANLNSDAVGSFFAPMCPGSQFAYDNISLSWSPLIIDIRGKGIKISRVFNRSVGFDIKGTGYKSYIDWPENTSDVAILVMPNAQGEVKSVRELFGDDKFSNGFEKLRSYDLNKDNRIDAHDAVFSKLRLWFDKNRDGKVDKDELQTLEQNGVQFITLEYGRPGSEGTAEQKTLSGLYFNSIEQKFMNIEDHYFYEYIDSQRVKAERGNKKKDVKKTK